MKTQIYLKGIDQLERNMNKVLKDVTSEKTKLLLEQARLVRDRIREKAPYGPVSGEDARRGVEPGAIKAAAYASALPEKVNSPAVAFAGIRPRKAPHAHLVEFGHGGPAPAPPHPFVRPAWDEMKDEVKRNIREGLKKTIEGAV